jgi:hypothetical protein
MKPALLALSLAAGLATGGSAWAQALARVVAARTRPVLPLAGEVALSPRQLAQLAAVRNPEIRYSRLGVDVAGYLSSAEAALYEAVLFGNRAADDITRQRTVEERLSSAAALNVLDERSTTIEAGVRQRLPTAGEVALSYRIIRRSNNIIASSTGNQQDTEWTGALVISIKQPLLRGAGRSVLETDRRVAELEHQVQWAQFRQQVLKSTAEALNLYWQLRPRAGSAAAARRIAAQRAQDGSDVEAAHRGRPLAAGQPAGDAGSTVLAREAEVTRAEQAVREAESRVMTALSLSAATQPGVRVKATLRRPADAAGVETLDAAVERALGQWPPYLVSQLRWSRDGCG